VGRTHVNPGGELNPLTILQKYFPTGTTEGERHILRKAFVQTEEFSQIITPPPFSPRILVGKKGSGKSAIIDFAISIFKATKVPVLLLKPSDIEAGLLADAESVGETTRIASDQLAKAIAKTLGSAMTGLIDASDKVLYGSWH
jgi:hypothetical protein